MLFHAQCAGQASLKHVLLVASPPRRRLQALCLAHSPLVPILSEKVGWERQARQHSRCTLLGCMPALQHPLHRLPDRQLACMHVAWCILAYSLQCCACLQRLPALLFACLQTGRQIHDPQPEIFTELLCLVTHTPAAALGPPLTPAFTCTARSSLQVGCTCGLGLWYV